MKPFYLKKAQKYQDCDDLNGYVVTLQKLDRALKVAIKRGEVTIEERKFNPEDKDLEL